MNGVPWTKLVLSYGHPVILAEEYGKVMKFVRGAQWIRIPGDLVPVGSTQRMTINTAHIVQVIETRIVADA